MTNNLLKTILFFSVGIICLLAFKPGARAESYKLKNSNIIEIIPVVDRIEFENTSGKTWKGASQEERNNYLEKLKKRNTANQNANKMNAKVVPVKSVFDIKKTKRPETPLYKFPKLKSLQPVMTSSSPGKSSN